MKLVDQEHTGAPNRSKKRIQKNYAKRRTIKRTSSPNAKKLGGDQVLVLKNWFQSVLIVHGSFATASACELGLGLPGTCVV